MRVVEEPMAYGVAMENLRVASSASIEADRRTAARPIGLRHAYQRGDERTLCGLTVRYLYCIENAKWSAKTPQRCPTCDTSATADEPTRGSAT
jgi:hypothetical protein